MEINKEASQIRHLKLSGTEEQNDKTKKDMLKLLKEKNGYHKDIDISNAKRARRNDIQKKSGWDIEKMNKLRDVLYTEEEKREINLSTSPFPNHSGYTKVRNTLNPEMQKEMQRNIKISTDGKIEIIPMGKKFSLLTARADNKDVLDGDFRYYNTIKGFLWYHAKMLQANITLKQWYEPNRNANSYMGKKELKYFNISGAERVCKKQEKHLLKNKSEVEQFINFFPGETKKEKIFNLIQIFGLTTSGNWYKEVDKLFMGWEDYIGLYVLANNDNTLSWIYWDWNKDMTEIDDAYIFEKKYDKENINGYFHPIIASEKS